MKEEKIPNARKSHQRVCGEFWNLGGQHNWEGKKKEPTDYMPSCDFQRTGSPDAHFRRQQARPEQGSIGCLHRVGTGSECPVDNLRELRRVSNPNCGITRKKKRERERHLSCEKL